MDYKLRKSAISDIRDIGRYTLDRFGAKQRNEYLLGLETQFKTISAEPYRHKPRNDISDGLCCCSYKQHLIFYRISANFVDVLAVLHKRMLPEMHLFKT
jgi:toxin ParE1/3/4